MTRTGRHDYISEFTREKILLPPHWAGEQQEIGMKAIQSEVTEKSVVRVIQDLAKVQIGAMTPSFPPARVPPQVSKDYERGQ